MAKLTQKLKGIGIAAGLAASLAGCTTQGEIFLNDIGNLAVATTIQQGIAGELNPASQPNTIGIQQTMQQPFVASYMTYPDGSREDFMSDGSRVFHTTWGQTFYTPPQ